MDDDKPTIDDLEAALNSGRGQAHEIKPDGEIVRVDPAEARRRRLPTIDELARKLDAQAQETKIRDVLREALSQDGEEANWIGIPALKMLARLVVERDQRIASLEAVARWVSVGPQGERLPPRGELVEFVDMNWGRPRVYWGDPLECGHEFTHWRAVKLPDTEEA